MNMNKKIYGLTAGMVLAIAVLGTSMSISAAESTIAEPVNRTETVSLNMEEAATAALKNAGLSEDAVTFSKKMSDYDNGVLIYDLHFMVPGQAKYEYKVASGTGAIVEREQESWEAEDSMEYQNLLGAATDYFDFENADVAQALADAISTAMEAAPENALLYKTGTDYDDGQTVFEIGFLVPGDAKYEYRIDCTDSSIILQDTDLWDDDDDMEYAALLEEAAPTGTTADTAAPSGSLTEEDAEKIALSDAGFSENDVTRMQSHKDFDDGIEQYEVSFYGPDGREYSYEISVSDGRILDREAEYDD